MRLVQKSKSSRRRISKTSFTSSKVNNLGKTAFSKKCMVDKRMKKEKSRGEMHRQHIFAGNVMEGGAAARTGRSIDEECYGGEEEKKKIGGNGAAEQDEQETKKNSSRGVDDGAETQREESVRAQQTPIDSLPGSRMLKRPNFGFFSNFANDAVNKVSRC